MDFKKLFGGIAREGVVSLLFDAVKYLFTIGLPFASAGLAVATSYLDPGIPWMYVYATAVVVFAMTAFGLHSFATWRESRSARNKLQITSIGNSWVYSGKDANGKSTGIRSVQLQINFKNLANFPMSMIVERFDASIDGNIATQKSWRGVAFPIRALDTKGFKDDSIPMRDAPLKTYDGRLSYLIRYGRPGKEVFVLHAEERTKLVYDSGRDSYRFETYDDVQPSGPIS